MKMDKKVLETLISDVSINTKLKPEVLEKDYYVSLILKDLSLKQKDLKAYFKGGTAVYKILNKFHRFSEDIDLTVAILEKESKTSNVNRLKKSAISYKIDGLLLDGEKTIDRKGSITAFYKYDSLFSISPLYKAGHVQVESTSFTVSEPTATYTIEPLVYKYASKEQKKILKEKFSMSEFPIEIIKLERMFIDKIFAAEFYYIRKEFKDVAKHLYDLAVLVENDEIKALLNNKNELEKLIAYKRKEEKIRLGEMDAKIKISDFRYLNEEISSVLLKEFQIMQEVYVTKEEYKIVTNKMLEVLKTIKSSFDLIN